jgi:NAD(P)-dependent dehydrogenase (short-subunit alcohol dehydrogenase family)
MVKTWFITGSSSGFGRIWAEAALQRGDRVAVTARSLPSVGDFVDRYGDNVLALELDVTDRARAFAAVQRAADHFGTLDVVVNNAGYGHFGMVEELTEKELRDQLETNLFGAVWVTQAALPIMRAQGSGRILQITSEGGVRAFPGLGAYHASKWALEGLSESLWQEVEPFGIRITNVEPGPYSTNWLARGSVTSEQNPAYAAMRESSEQAWEVGDAEATAAAVLELVDSADPPHRLLLGRSFEAIADLYAHRLHAWEEWQSTSLRAFGAPSGR